MLHNTASTISQLINGFSDSNSSIMKFFAIVLAILPAILGAAAATTDDTPDNEVTSFIGVAHDTESKISFRGCHVRGRFHAQDDCALAKPRGFPELTLSVLPLHCRLPQGSGARRRHLRLCCRARGTW